MMFDHTHGLSGHRILTGDRPTGPLHIGHLAGTLAGRVQLQVRNRQTILIADLQALTDNAGNPAKVSSNVLELALDYLAAGIDPAQTTIALQSGIPELAELSTLYMNLVPVSRLLRNPTIKSEIEARGFGDSLPAGFLCYPVSQAADITAFCADLVPAGADQAPLVELSNEIAMRINRMAGEEVLPRAELLQSHAPRLPGIDGRRKMSKSAGNAIMLSDEPDDIRRKVFAMYTDHGHLRVSDPGKVEGNVVFAMLDAFDLEPEAVADLKERYRAGGLGDMVLKRRAEAVLQDLLAPIRARRKMLASEAGEIRKILEAGTAAARETVQPQHSRVRRAFGLA